jgi:hypothetical protein
MTQPVHHAVDPAIVQYANGTISALKAASLLGNMVTVAEVILMTKAAGLSPPRQTPEQEKAELAHARHVLGMD